MMTKSEIRKEMRDLIDHYYKSADGSSSEEKARLERAKIAGIETLASRLNIKLWQDEKMKIESAR